MNKWSILICLFVPFTSRYTHNKNWVFFLALPDHLEQPSKSWASLPWLICIPRCSSCSTSMSATEKNLKLTLHCVLCSLPNPLSMSLKAKQSIYNYKHVPDSIYPHNKENQEGLYRWARFKKIILVMYMTSANKQLFRWKERKYLFIMSNANIERSAGSVISSQQKF